MLFVCDWAGYIGVCEVVLRAKFDRIIAEHSSALMLGPAPLLPQQQSLPHPQQQQQPQQQPQQQNPNAPPPPLNGQDVNLSNILHFLQSEWRRYERERNEWEIERAEMRVRLETSLSREISPHCLV